jgi:hypothetical protein
LPSYGGQAGIATELKPFIAQLRNQLEERGRAADKGFPDNRYLRFEKGEPILTPVEALPDPEGSDQSLSLIKERGEGQEISDEVLAPSVLIKRRTSTALGDTNFTLGGLRIHYRSSASPQTSKSAQWIRPVWPLQVNPMT